MLFFVGIIVSHTIFIVNLFVDLEISIGIVSYVLLIVGFLLFVTEVLLALSIEKGQLTGKNILTVILMYIIYTQLWLFLIINALRLECKRIILRQEVTWYKTKRYKEESIH